MLLWARAKSKYWLLLPLWLAVQSWAQAQSLPDFTGLVERTKSVVVNVSTTAAPMEADRGAHPGIPNMPDLPDGVPFDEFLRKFFEDRGQDGFPPELDRESLGSGFIVSADGYIISNHHVVHGADQIIVRLSDRREFEAELVGTDRNSDIALLKIDAKDLPVANLGDSDGLKVGEWVVAIGSPFGFEHSVTAGVVSAKGRALPNENYVPFIQTDVAINPGNSGGPLFNLEGEVVGVNSQIFSRTGGYMGLSFAIPSKVAMDVVKQLKETGRVSRGWLGVYIQDVNRDLAESFGMQTPRGALVAQVIPDGPAAKAGVQVGDIIVGFDGRPVDRSAALPPMVGVTPADTKVQLEVIRDGKSKTIPVKIEELPEPDTQAKAEPPAPKTPGINKRLGIAVTDPTAEQREILELGDGGVIVEQVATGPARDVGMRQGDGIVMLDGERVKNAEHFRKLVEQLKPGRTVAVLVHRRSGPVFLPLKIPAK